jgi:aspartyl aminopeptidase
MTHEPLSAAELSACAGLLKFIDASPTPFHTVASAVATLSSANFTPLSAREAWRLQPASRHYLISGDGAIAAFALPESPAERLRGFRIVGAHTDSPNLRLKPRGVFEKSGYVQLAVEVYGSPLLNSWLDRDLYLAGRVVYRAEDGQLSRQLVRLDEPIVRVAQLAVHLDREVNEKGLTLNRQEHLSPIVTLGTSAHGGTTADELLKTLCAAPLGISPASIVTTELQLADSTPARRGGLHGELLFAPRLDNLMMCHAALQALTRVSAAPARDAGGFVPIVVLFDHEEVGSGSAYGAQSPLLPSVLERIVYSLGLSRDDYLRVLGSSLCVSADMAHAVHPNYADRHDPHHRPLPNGGPVIKSNAQQRYATCGRTAALFSELCRKEEVPVQHYAHRSDLPCGSTIGPITATLLGIPTVDVGNAMLSMHSARELAGARDAERMARVLARFLSSTDLI